MGTKVGRSIASHHKYTETPDGQKYIQDTIQNASAHVKNFLPAVIKLMKVAGNPTAVQSIGAQNYSAIMSQVSAAFSGGKQEEKLEFDCELLLMTPNNELTEAQLEKKEICEELLAFVDEEIRTGTVNNDVFVDPAIGQTGLSDFANTQSGLSVTISAIANLISNVSEQTTYVSNNFTHVANETSIRIYSNSISNASFVTFNANGHVRFANGVSVGTDAEPTERLDLTTFDASGGSFADIDTVIDETSDSGALIQGGRRGHLVLALRENGSSDTISFVSGGGNWDSDETYDTLIMKLYANGNVVIPGGLVLTETFTAASTLSAGDLCYLDSSGEMDLTDADAETTADTLLSVATEAITSASSGAFLLSGKHETTGLTTGSVYYVSTTAGDWTTTRPSGTGDIVRIVGYALSTTVLYFNPDGTYVEIA